MPELLDALRRTADQDIDQMHRAKTLPGAVGASTKLLRDHVAVAQDRRRQAVVAIAAFGGAGPLAEISEQPGAPAVGGFGQPNQRLQFADRDPLETLHVG